MWYNLNSFQAKTLTLIFIFEIYKKQVFNCVINLLQENQSFFFYQKKDFSLNMLYQERILWFGP